MKDILKNEIIEDLCNTKFTGILHVTFDSGEIIEVSRQPQEKPAPENVKSIISFWQMRFRVLHDWDIAYDDLAAYKSQCTHNKETKQAIIYELSKDDKETDIKKYVLHEVTHIAYEASRDDREMNELFTQDLTAMLNYYNKI